MSLLALVGSLGALFLLLEAVFFGYCFRWLSSGRRAREKEFARLDFERGELLELQSALSTELARAKKMSEETTQRLSRLGAEAHAEWNDMMERMGQLLGEVETRTRSLTDENLSQIHRNRLTLEKTMRDAAQTGTALDERLVAARDLLRFFDRNVPTEEIVKEIQAEKYTKARRMLTEGMESAAICKKLGLSHGEVSLLSFVKCFLVASLASLAAFLTSPHALAQSSNPSSPEVQDDGAPPAEDTPGMKVQTREKKIQKDGETVVLREKLVTQDNSVGTGFAVFLGLDLGVIKSVTALPDIETDKQGTEIGGRLVGSVYPENWVFDLGLGWFYSSLTGDERLVDPVTGKRDEEFNKVKIITYAALVEVAARFRITRGLQLGLALDGLYGEDLSFSSEPYPKDFKALVGAQIFYGVPEKAADIRWGFSIFTDLNIPDRQMYWALVSVQIGLPLVKPDTIYREKTLLATREKVEKEEVKRIVPKYVVKEVVKFVFHQETLRFPPKKALIGNNQGFLIDLATTLNSVSDTWDEVTVEGHVNPDSMPNEALAMRLSSARAAAVRNAIVAAGVNTDIAKSRGFGSSRPFNTTDRVSPLNERLELSFSGVSNAGKLNDALTMLQRRRLKPETCNAQGCK